MDVDADINDVLSQLRIGGVANARRAISIEQRLFGQTARIVELEATLMPYAKETGGGLSGKEPNAAWNVLNGLKSTK